MAYDHLPHNGHRFMTNSPAVTTRRSQLSIFLVVGDGGGLGAAHGDGDEEAGLGARRTAAGSGQGGRRRAGGRDDDDGDRAR